jgi:hypothetical protein
MQSRRIELLPAVKPARNDNAAVGLQADAGHRAVRVAYGRKADVDCTIGIQTSDSVVYCLADHRKIAGLAYLELSFTYRLLPVK